MATGTLTIKWGASGAANNTTAYHDPLPADPDPTVTLFGNAAVSWTGTANLGSITIGGLQSGETLSSSTLPAHFTLTQNSDGTYTLAYTGPPGQSSTTVWDAALNSIKFHSTNDPALGTTDTLTFTAKTTGGDNFTRANIGSEDIQYMCFYPGTLIRTPDGEVAVETLKPGDLVLTADGAVKPVNWLGRQTISTRLRRSDARPADPHQGRRAGRERPVPRPAGLARSRHAGRRRADPCQRAGQRSVDRPRDQGSARLHLLSHRTRRPFADPGRKRAGRDLRR